MASATVGKASGAAAPRVGERLLAAVAGQGSGAHPHLASEALLKGADAARNLSDAVHFLCALHGRHPGLVDHAGSRSVQPLERAWFDKTSEGFARERAFLTRIAVAAGPVPSTPGASGAEAAVIGQRHAIEMLARSERSGCALGAALAFSLDWGAMRPVLEAAAKRFGVDAPPSPVEDANAVARFAEAAAETAAFERALLFGAEQILIQHFGLWDLLEARALARAAS